MNKIKLLYIPPNFCWMAYETTLLSLCQCVPLIVARHRTVTVLLWDHRTVCMSCSSCRPCCIKGKLRVCLRTSYAAIQDSESFACIRAYLITSEFSIILTLSLLLRNKTDGGSSLQHWSNKDRVSSPTSSTQCPDNPVRDRAIAHPFRKLAATVFSFMSLDWAPCRTDIPSFRPALACFEWKEIQAILRVAWILSSLTGLDLQQISRQHLDPESTSPH
jgi:hypothetical protein